MAKKNLTYPVKKLPAQPWFFKPAIPRIGFVIVIVVLAIAVIYTMTNQSINKDPFSGAVGEWESIHLRDQSTQHLVINRLPTGEYTFTYFDEREDFCDGASREADFEGTPTGNTITVSVEFRCTSAPDKIFRREFINLFYEPETDQLIGPEEHIWHRIK